jgi:hypothetical protein
MAEKFDKMNLKSITNTRKNRVQRFSSIKLNEKKSEDENTRIFFNI